MSHSLRIFVTSLLLMLVLAPGVQAQILSGPWVDQQNQRIETHRKGNLRIIVLDHTGKPVPGAQVHLAMQRHDFQFGVRLDGWMFRQGMPEALSADAEKLWQLFNTVSIEEPARWIALSPSPGQTDWSQLDRMLTWSAQRGLPVRWGEMLSQDVSRLPVWAAKLPPQELALAMEQHLAQVAHQLAGRATQWDVLTGLPDHTYLDPTPGQPAMARRLLAQAQALNPDTPRHIRFSDTLTGPRLAQMVQTLADLRDAQVPFTGLSLECKLGGQVAYVTLERSLAWLDKLNLPLSIVNLEVGGPSPASAAVNLETTLRTLFSYPSVQGVWLNGVTPQQVIDPSSALIDEQGRLTPSGQLVQDLIGQLWWTDEVIAADALGNVRGRYFAGAYRIHAAWPQGQAHATTYLKTGSQTQLVIVQQLPPTPAQPTHPAGAPSP